MGKENMSGKYRGRVQIGSDENGKPINKYVCARTKQELEVRKEEMRRHYIGGVAIREDMVFWQFAEEWYTLKKEPFISEASKSSYRSCFNKHILPAFGLRHLRAIRSAELQAFVNGYSRASKSQITLMIGILKSLMSSAYAEGITERDPSVALIRPKARKKEARRALTPFETQRVLETIERHPHGLFLAALYYLGLRRGEALGHKWGDFDWEEGLVHVQRDIDYTGSTAQDGDLKTDAADRYVPVPDELHVMLAKARSLPDQYVFHNDKFEPLSQNSFRRIWWSLMQDAGCVVEREVEEETSRPTDILKRLKPTQTPHYFRQNYVPLLYKSGVDPLVAMKMVGHRDYQTTANIYTHLKEDSLKKAAADMATVFKKKDAKQVKKAVGVGREMGDNRSRYL